MGGLGSGPSLKQWRWGLSERPIAVETGYMELKITEKRICLEMGSFVAAQADKWWFSGRHIPVLPLYWSTPPPRVMSRWSINLPYLSGAD